MIIISAGIPKSGSTLLMYYTQLLIKGAFGNNGQIAFEKWVQDGPVGGIEAFPWESWTDHLDTLETISIESGPFVLKTHKEFPELSKLIANEIYKIIFSFRDPRDIILSAIDHGNRSLLNNETYFTECTNIKSTALVVEGWCKSALPFLDSDKVLKIHYEQLVLNPEHQLERLGNYLGLSDAQFLARKAVMGERMTRQPNRNQFNKGQALRYINEMSAEDQIFSKTILGKYIDKFNYL